MQPPSAMYLSTLKVGTYLPDYRASLPRRQQIRSHSRQNSVSYLEEAESLCYTERHQTVSTVTWVGYIKPLIKSTNFS